MLSPMLKEIKTKLAAKEFSRRTTREDQLLAELETLEELLEQDITLTESLKAMKIVSGPSNVCACCGK